MIFQIAFSSLVILVGIFYWRWRSSRFVRLINALPGLTFWSAIAEGIFLSEEEISKSMHFMWARRYGPIYRTWVLNKPIIILSSPEMMEPIVSTSKLITKSYHYDWWKAWFGDSIVLATGNNWKARRRLIVPAFHTSNMESYLDVFNKKSLFHANQLENTIMTSNSEVVEVYSFIMNLAVDIVCDTLLGFTYAGYKETTQYAQNLDRFDDVIVNRLKNPLLALDWIFWKTPFGRETKKIIKSLRSFTDPVMEFQGNVSKKENLTAIDGPKSNFLDLLFKSDGVFSTKEEIQGEIDTYVQGGHDSITITLSFLIYCLARHQDKQEQVAKELEWVFGSNKDQPCSKQDLAELKYLECCIKETLRLYPANPNIMRCITEDVKVGGFTLPAGATVVLAVYGMHRNPQVYSDPESFKPERFLPEQSVGRHPESLMSFSSGPRNCIGQNYAMVEMKTIMAHLLRRFHFSSTEHPDQPLMKPARLVLLKPRNGIKIIVKNRV